MNGPDHYCKDRKIQPIDVWNTWGVLEVACFCNALKYIGRLGRKDDVIQELDKAIDYLDKALHPAQKNKDMLFSDICKDWGINDYDMYMAISHIVIALDEFRRGDDWRYTISDAKYHLEKYKKKVEYETHKKEEDVVRQKNQTKAKIYYQLFLKDELDKMAKEKPIGLRHFILADVFYGVDRCGKFIVIDGEMYYV